MTAYFEAQSLGGCAKWMKVQAKEEMNHALKFFGFLIDRGERVELAAIAKPDADFSSVKDVFEKTLEHEKLVTASIHKLYKLAESVDDSAAEVLLHWYIDEQVEEEKNAMDILGKLEFVGDKKSPGILMLDKALGERSE
jgi:ferritin